MKQNNEIQNLEEIIIAALHTKTDHNVLSVAASHALNMNNELILVDSADSPSLEHAED